MASISIWKSATSEDDDNEEADEVENHVNRVEGCNDSDREQKAGSSQPSELDLSHFELDVIPEHYVTPTAHYRPDLVHSLSLRSNRLVKISDSIVEFKRLTALDLSNNQLFDIPPILTSLKDLQILVLKTNHLDSNSFPKHFNMLQRLEILNLSGNQIEEMPLGITDLKLLKFLHLGGNRLRTLPCKLGDMLRLETLYLGGNELQDVPATIGKLKNLISLTLSDNKLETIPSTVAYLRRLENLSLHNNNLRTLPVELVKLRNLQQLSLRSNPLVVRFVRDMAFDPPTLKELAGRTIKVSGSKKCSFTADDLPISLISYLDSAHHCVNPKCKGVYFEARVEHVKFVDFCGKYRVPLLQYLCSPRCSVSPAFAYSTDASSDADSSDLDEDTVPKSKLRKVLLG